VRADDDEDALHTRIKAVEHALLVETVGHMAREGFDVDGRKVRLR
jgi:phosphoribosylglycinamide formyltransferase 1